MGSHLSAIAVKGRRKGFRTGATPLISSRYLQRKPATSCKMQGAGWNEFGVSTFIAYINCDAGMLQNTQSLDGAAG
jgi:hypothetical protein